MKNFFFKLFLLSVVLTLSNSSLLAQFEWEKYSGNPLNIHGSPGSWDQSIGVPCVIFNSDLNRYEMWYTSFDNLPNNGIGFAWSTDGIDWSNKYPTPVLIPDATSWDYPFIGVACVLKEGGTYKMWYTGGQSSNLTSSHIGYATSPDGISWTKYSGNPVLSPGTGWESGAVGYPSVIEISGTYYMFYSGAVTVGIARTGRAISSDGINWLKYSGNPVLLAGGVGEWDRNNYLGKVIELDNNLYIYYTAESNPGVGGSAIGGAVSTDMGITWTKFENNPILQQGLSGQWDYGWIEGGCPVFAQNELRLYYDGGGAATGWLGRIGFAFSDPLPAGTYTIGTGGNFATIQDAFDKLETDGVAGNVTLELIDELYTAPADTFGFLLDGPITGADPWSRITIKPAENKNVTVEGNWRFVFTFRNISYVTLDGVSTEGATTLTIHSLYNAQYVTNRGVGFLWDSDHNIVQNLIVICDDYLREGPGIFFQAATNSLFAADSNLIQNNFIKKAGCAIYVSSWAGNQNTRVVGNIIRGNKIGSENDSLVAWGIQMEKSQNAIIENNIVQNLKLNNGYAWENMNIGINSYQGNGDIIRNNVVHNIKASGGYTGVGILLSGEGSWYGNNNLVYNNMVYDIQSTSTQSDSRVAGIQVWMQENPKIYYNSVYLTGIGANQFGSGALYIWNTCTNVEAKNNILVNTRDESPYCASVIYIQGGHSILSISDYNDLYFDETITSSCLARAGGDYETLAYWQQTGKDSNSVTEMPKFVDPYLHIDENIETYLESRGTPITGIDTDIDGNYRNAITPDIGADEFDGIAVGVEDEETLPKEFALDQNYPNPFNPSTTFRYSIPQSSKVVIKVFDILGNEIATLMDEEKSVGNYELAWNAENLPSGVYFYQLKAREFISTKKMILLK